jgi:hypothetical protein
MMNNRIQLIVGLAMLGGITELRKVQRFTELAEFCQLPVSMREALEL